MATTYRPCRVPLRFAACMAGLFALVLRNALLYARGRVGITWVRYEGELFHASPGVYWCTPVWGPYGDPLFGSNVNDGDCARHSRWNQIWAQNVAPKWSSFSGVPGWPLK